MTDHDKQPPEKPPDPPEPVITPLESKEEALNREKGKWLIPLEREKDEQIFAACKIMDRHSYKESPSNKFSWLKLLRLIALPLFLFALIFILVAMLWP